MFKFWIRYWRREYVGCNVTLKVLSRELGYSPKSKRLYCQCDLIKLHSHINYEQFEVPLNNHYKLNRWKCVTFTKNIVNLRKAFNEFFNKQFYTLFPFLREISITFCKNNVINYINYKRHELSRQKWFGNMYYMKHDFIRYSSICTPKFYNEECYTIKCGSNKCGRVCWCAGNYCFFKPWLKMYCDYLWTKILFVPPWCINILCLIFE